MNSKERKKTWDEKINIVHNSYLRAKNNRFFAKKFYKKLFFLNPDVKSFFSNTDFVHQEKALLHGLDILFLYFSNDSNGKSQVTRLGKVHNINGLNIHPHHYYYWIEALVLTIKELDTDWYDDLEYYIREVISYPISFFISQYFVKT